MQGQTPSCAQHQSSVLLRTLKNLLLVNQLELIGINKLEARYLQGMNDDLMHISKRQCRLTDDECINQQVILTSRTRVLET